MNTFLCNPPTRSNQLLLETLCVSEGHIRHWHLHQNRMQQSRLHCFQLTNLLPVIEYVHQLLEKVPNPCGAFRCRLIYGDQIQRIELLPYQKPNIQTIQLMTADSMEYALKWTDRHYWDDLLFQKLPQADEILIVKNGRITDTSRHNILCQKDGIWYTPDCPLLAGTMRQHLLDQGKIILKAISPGELWEYEQIHLINALTEPGALTVPINQIIERKSDSCL